MSRLNAIRLTQSLRNRLVDFCLAHNHLRNEELRDVCRRFWSGSPEEGGLASELWVEGSIPHLSSGESLFDLVDRGRFSARLAHHLEDRGVFTRDMLLHAHQRDAIEASIVRKNPAIVVSAGTGAGKTESFLLPILNDLFENRSNNQNGCRAIIMYPMNALVNDQVDRLYHWLQGQTDVTLCHFTSETPEDHRAARRLPPYHPCRFRTRNQARGIETADGKRITGGPVPDILITNYSMLEYMLCRPQDSVFFGPSLRAVVLDEAHLYTSTLAAEITLLLRRLYDKCGLTSQQVNQFATSATIGTGKEGELEEFAAKLFSKPVESVVAIRGRTAETALPLSKAPDKTPEPSDLIAHEWEHETIFLNKDGEEELVHDAKACDGLKSLLNRLVDQEVVRQHERESSDTPARLLRSLAYSPLVAKLESLLRRKKQWPLNELAYALWERRGAEAEQATATLLNLCAAARSDLRGAPLLPHRLHFMLRPPDSLTFCCNPDCSGNKVSGLGKAFAHHRDNCDECEAICLPLFRCTCCGESFLGADLDGGELKPPAERDAQRYFSLSDEGGQPCTINFERGLLSGQGASGLSVWQCQACPNCGSDSKSFRATNAMTNIVLSILAETMIAELPPIAKQKGSNQFLPAEGRRLLAFSDSRSEAARLGPRLRHQHEIQLVRAAIVQMFEETPGADPELLNYYQGEIERREAEIAGSTLPAALLPAKQKELETVKLQYQALTAGNSVDIWSEQLKKKTQLQQLLHDESGEGHTAEAWSQSQWEANFRKVREEATFLLGREMFRLPRRSLLSVETIGCVEVVYPGLDQLDPPGALIGEIPSAKARKKLKECWSDLLSALFDTVRYDSAVTLGTEELDTLWQEQNHVPGRWLSVESFVGSTEKHRRRKFVSEVLRVAGQEDPSDYAELVLRAAWDQTLAKALIHQMGSREVTSADQLSWLETKKAEQKDGTVSPAIRLIFPNLVLRKPATLFVSPQTGHVWPRSVLGCAPDPGGDGCLVPISGDELDKTPVIGRLRREFTSDLPVFKYGLWAEEHSAQLSAKEARRRQELFRCGIRNLLSATTTLELGIDIGGLSGTFLSNVPPGLANYLQRAGRVGRRADGSSIVVTCARERPYDREVFRRIGDFLRKPLRRPLVLLGRARIASRHFHAWLMGRFFEQLYYPDTHVGAMRAFGSMGVFCGRSLPQKWQDAGNPKPELQAPLPPLNGEFLQPEWWTDCPEFGLVVPFRRWLEHLNNRLGDFQNTFDEMFRDTPLAGADWRKQLANASDIFESGREIWEKRYDELLQSWRESDQRAQANSIQYQLKALHGLTVIEAFANERFLPRYGFPIGIHKLRVIEPDEKGRTRELDQYRLERPGVLALREYVPGSQLLVGGKLITSRGLLKHWSGANLDNALGLRGGAGHCKNKHFFYWIGEKITCPQCDEKLQGVETRLLFPAHGFTTAAWDPPRRSSDIERVGTVSTGTTDFAVRGRGTSKEREKFAGVEGVRARYREDADILVYNNGDNGQGFAICTKCGYADSERANRSDGLPPRFERHIPLHQSRGTPCWGVDDSPVIRNQNLAAREPTDLLMLDFSGFLGAKADDRNLIASLSVALRLAGARVLELDSRELGDLTVRVGNAWGVVLYDNVPGGAGHVLELLERDKEWLEAAERLLFINEHHDSRCKSACLDCILTFDGQSNFVGGKVRLDRRKALESIRQMRQAAGIERPAQISEVIEFIEPEVLEHLDVIPPGAQSGYEFMDSDGRVNGEVEIAWPSAKVCLALEHQLEGAEAAKQSGWKVYELSDTEKLLEELAGASV